jgi:hypothetical protein
MKKIMLMHLSSNMWGKKGFSYNDQKEDEDFIYRDKMYTDKETWVKVTDFCAENGFNTVLIDLGDAVVYDSHPEIAIEGAWTKAELKAELDRLRKIGLTPIPKYNFSSAHSAWLGKYGYMVGTDEYYKVCRELIEEVIDLFDTPEFFHLGMEEEDAASQTHRPIAIVRSPEIMARDINLFADICRNKGVRACLWTNAETVKGLGGDEEFCKKLPKDIIMTPYYYGWIRSYHPEESYPETVKLFRKLTEWGYDIIACGSTWSWHLSMFDVMTYCKKYAKQDKIMGYLMASWMLTTPKKYHALLNAAYNFKTAYEEVFEA